MKPMLAHKYEPKRFRTPCIVQPKLNGVRALWQPCNGFWSRDEIPWPKGKLVHLEKELLALNLPRTFLLDGELYVHGWSLQKINSAVAVKSPQISERTTQVEYHIFDCPDESRCFSVRYLPFAQLIAHECRMIKPLFSPRVFNQFEAEHYYSKFVGLGYEGMMYKFDDHGYTQPHKDADKENRTFHMLKRKDWQDDDYTITGIQEGRDTDKGGKYVGTLGTFICVTAHGKYFSVGSGLSDSERHHFWNNDPTGKKCKVKYLCLSDEGIPLNPTILSVDEVAV